MQVGCPRCGQVLDFSHLPPRFCSNGGRPLRRAPTPSPVALDPPTRTAGGTQVAAADPGATVAFPAPHAPAPHPEAVGGYRLLRSLGTGGMGTVYEAEE